jgi:hypothetical protein
LFVVATANGGKMSCIFEPSDARMSTFPLLRSTSMISPVTTWCTTPPAALALADGPGELTTTGVPVEDGSVVVVVPGVVWLEHPTVTSRSPVPKTVRGFITRVPPLTPLSAFSVPPKPLRSVIAPVLRSDPQVLENRDETVVRAGTA